MFSFFYTVILSKRKSWVFQNQNPFHLRLRLEGIQLVRIEVELIMTGFFSLPKRDWWRESFSQDISLGKDFVFPIKKERNLARKFVKDLTVG
mgnify:CR=1 FL=1